MGTLLVRLFKGLGLWVLFSLSLPTVATLVVWAAHKYLSVGPGVTPLLTAFYHAIPGTNADAPVAVMWMALVLAVAIVALIFIIGNVIFPLTSDGGSSRKR